MQRMDLLRIGLKSFNNSKGLPKTYDLKKKVKIIANLLNFYLSIV